MPEELVKSPLDQIDPFLHQSRIHFSEEELHLLAADIRLNGQLQPGVAVFDAGRNRYSLICGERRLRALAIAGIETMLLRLMPGPLSLADMLQINISENLQRASLNPIERAKAFRRLMQVGELTASEVATRMSVSVATVSRELSLLELGEDLQAKVASGSLPVSVASLIVRLPDDDSRRALIEQYAVGGITRDGIAAMVKKRSRATVGDKPSRLGWKVGGVTCRVDDAAMGCDTLLSALGTLTRAAKALKERGISDLGQLAGLLPAGDRLARPAATVEG